MREMTYPHLPYAPRLQRVEAGRYRSEDGRWLIERGTLGCRCEWIVRHDGELWGNWERVWHGDGIYREYLGFESLKEALEHIDAVRWKEGDGPESTPVGTG